MINISEILELHEKACQDAANYPVHRQLYNQIHSDTGRHFIGIVGPRGVGKTVILKQLTVARPDTFYLSADTLEETDLFQVARLLAEQYKIKILLIDEVHFAKAYDRDLKKIFDFLDLRVIFTSSVSLALFESSYDLSRRIRLNFLYPFSFREYLLFTRQVDIPMLTITDILENRWTAEHMRFEHLFDNYLQGRLFPFFLDEPEVKPLLQNICLKVIRKDIPLVHNLRFSDIEKIEKMVGFIGKSPVDGINYSSISRNVGITKYKAELFVKLLSQAFILNPVFPKGTSVLKEPKVLMYLPFRLLYQDWSQCVGAIREDFFAETMKMKNYPFHYLKTTRGAKTPDFLVEDGQDRIVIEIGGKGKGREQFKGIKAEKKLILSHSADIKGIRKPIFLLGFLV